MVSADTYILPITITTVLLLFQLFTPLIHTTKSMQAKIIAYADCAEEMMDAAFLGKVVNFSQCYVEKLKNVELANCILRNTTVICEYKGEVYVFSLEEN